MVSTVTPAAIPDIDFVVLFPDEDVVDFETLAAFLESRFPDYKFGAGTDTANMSEEHGFAVIPILSGDPIPDSGNDAFTLKPYPPEELLDDIYQAVRDFLSGTLPRLN